MDDALLKRARRAVLSAVTPDQVHMANRFAILVLQEYYRKAPNSDNLQVLLDWAEEVRLCVNMKLEELNDEQGNEGEEREKA